MSKIFISGKWLLPLVFELRKFARQFGLGLVISLVKLVEIFTCWLKRVRV